MDILVCSCFLFVFCVNVVLLLEYGTVQNQYQISQPMKYLKSNFPEGIALESCFLSPNEISLLEASIEETIERGDWLNAVVCVAKV